MKKVFAISALSLAIAVVNGAHAESKKMVPEECVAEGGQGESLAEWGMWCGVGSFLAALSEMAPTAAGPEGPGFDSGPGDPTGRGEADDFEPSVNQDEVTPHITLPEGEGEFVGYFASQDNFYEENYESGGDDYGGDYGDFLAQVDGGYDNRYGDNISNHQTGGFDLSLEEGGYGDPVAFDVGGDYGGPIIPATVDYNRYDRDGNPIDGQSFSSGDNNRKNYTNVFIHEDDEKFSNFSARYVEDSESQDGDTYSDEIIAGAEVLLEREYESDGPSDSARTLKPEFEVLKNYWGGYFTSISGRDDRESESLTETERRGAFVTGIYTVLQDIQRKISGDVSAVYSGNSHQWNQSVRLDVDFGDERFTGDFTDMDSSSKLQAGIDTSKDMSFSAEGVVQGIHLISESVSADAGFVQGTFFGDEGRIVGGAYDITKQGDRVVDVFTAVEGKGNQTFVPLIK